MGLRLEGKKMVAIIQHDLLVVSGGRGIPEVLGALACQEPRLWRVQEARNLEQARYLLQHEACEAILIDEEGCGKKDVQRLIRLASRHGVPGLVLAGPGPAGETGCSPGASRRLPFDLVRSHPILLAEALGSALRHRSLWRRERRTDAELRECRRQVSHLLALLWEAAPENAPVQWFTQRIMLERLEEEVTRARRYHVPVSVAVGVMPLPDTAADSAAGLPGGRTWIVDRIVCGKRRSDIAGQYGPHGILLIMPNTPPDAAGVCCRRLQDLMEHPPTTTPERPPGFLARTCFGVAGLPGETSSAAAVLARAEECLEKAESEGAERVVVG